MDTLYGGQSKGEARAMLQEVTSPAINVVVLGSIFSCFFYTFLHRSEEFVKTMQSTSVQMDFT